MIQCTAFFAATLPLLGVQGQRIYGLEAYREMHAVSGDRSLLSEKAVISGCQGLLRLYKKIVRGEWSPRHADAWWKCKESLWGNVDAINEMFKHICGEEASAVDKLDILENLNCNNAVADAHCKCPATMECQGSLDLFLDGEWNTDTKEWDDCKGSLNGNEEAINQVFNGVCGEEAPEGNPMATLMGLKCAQGGDGWEETHCNCNSLHGAADCKDSLVEWNTGKWKFGPNDCDKSPGAKKCIESLPGNTGDIERVFTKVCGRNPELIDVSLKLWMLQTVECDKSHKPSLGASNHCTCYASMEAGDEK